jgi:hypothetical protein
MNKHGDSAKAKKPGTISTCFPQKEGAGGGDCSLARQMLMFAVVIVMQWSVAVCPMVVYLLKHLVDFCYRHKNC